MKTLVLTICRNISSIMLILLLTGSSFGATFTATSSGNFSSATTWSGGTVPPLTNVMDMIIIPSGININLDNTLTINGALASITVEGTLTTNSSSSLMLMVGTLAGAGAVILDTVDMKLGSTLLFTGSLTANTLNLLTGFQSSANITVNQTLNLVSGTLTLISGGKLTMSSNGTIVISGGLLSVGTGGSVGLTRSYNVIYIGNSSTAGVELSGVGLQDVTLNVDSSKSVTLTSDLAVAGTLSLKKGTLILAGKDLTINGGLTDSGGSVSSSITSSIAINTSGGTSGTIMFGGVNSEVNNLTISIGGERQAKIGGNVTVNGALQLNSGILNFSKANLVLKGAITGSGTLSGGDSSNLTVSTTNSVALKFAANGQVIKNLTISPSGSNSVQLASSLTVHGILTLNGRGGALHLNGNSLTLGAASSIIGTDSIVSNSSSDLTINSMIGISALNLTGGIRNLTVNTGETVGVALGHDLEVNGMLNLKSGTLVLNSKNLSINGTISTDGTSGISSTAASNIIINTSGGTNGVLIFNGAASAINNLTVNVGTGNQAKIGGNITVNGALQLNGGTLNFSNTHLTVKGTITGSGSLSGNGSSNLTVNTTTGATLNFAAGGQLVKDLSISPSAGNSVTLGSSLAVNGVLSLNGGGTLHLNGNTLILGETSSIVGSDSIVSTVSSDLIINSEGGISLLNLTGGIRNLTINSGSSGNVNLGSNLTVSGILSMQNGVLRLNGKDLTIAGDISVGGTGTISSDSTSDITIFPGISPLGGLRFSSNANTVGNLSVAMPNGGSVNIGTDLNISGKLNLTGGALNIGVSKLSIETSGSIQGTGNSSFIITEAGGSLGMNVSVGESNKVIFPIGTLTHYAPATVQLNSGSGSGKIYIGVMNDVKAQGTTGVDISVNQPVVDATWDVSSNITANLNMNLKVMWSAAKEVNGFNRTSAYISHYVNGKWDTSLEAAATSEAGGMFSLERAGITSLSPFTVFDKTTTVVKEKGDLSFEIYPNPTVDAIIIQNPAVYTEPVTMDIYNSLGQLISSYKLTDPTSTISVREFVSGNYFIKFSNKGVSSIRYFTKI